MDAAAVRKVRSFNRTTAERIGALSDGFLGRGRPMGESRTLWEVGQDGAEVRELRARHRQQRADHRRRAPLRTRLGLDSGYASRVLQSLERQGLVKVRPSGADARVRQVELTPAGVAECAELDRRADRVAWSFLEPLPVDKRANLVNAMVEVDRLLQASTVVFGVEDPTTADAQWCIQQYFDELNQRFETGFDPTLGIQAEAHELVAPAGALMIASLRGRPVGCGALKFHGRAPAELKRMWVSREARGLGLGRRLLAELERHAIASGVKVVRLETNRTLKEAIALYRSSGYREVQRFNDEPYAHHWFEKRLRKGS